MLEGLLWWSPTHKATFDPAGHVSVTFRVVPDLGIDIIGYVVYNIYDLGKSASQTGGGRETGNARLRRPRAIPE